MKTQIFALAIAAMIFSGCKKDEDCVECPPDPNEQELVTTITLILSDSAGLQMPVIAQFRDPDGAGGNPPIQTDSIKLLANRTYNAEIFLLDESKVPADTISNEVREEAEDHQFFFHFIGPGLVLNYLDQDSNQLPIGLLTKWRTSSAGTGTAQVILKHQPGSKNGTEAPGETDLDVTFQLQVQ